ncbi:hypothetical protein PIB30_072413 [Stylosanthes scabra]|uniref:Retrotransposon gag domain-containing protein n=1 Tax=Stylosanthes scabra TaxID=79078 RepID=A0ABU6SP86_9FABA|nr:hypothetical protein [Stylosanthes scabra]
MLQSNSDPDLLVSDPEIERFFRHIRQVRRRIHFENTKCFQIEEIASESASAYSFASETDIELPSSDTDTITMGDLPIVTLKQMGEASMALENQPVRYPELNKNFELKSGLINLLPAKDWNHSFPGEVTADWAAFKRRFLEKYFRPSRTNAIRKEILRITQLHGN